ncbi:MAG: cation diffusion facilitator family transporter [Streptosporangiales bacterium]|nr:cation diffusion facilitator family transporter [Streptosporangiales bacterium]
MVDVGSEHGHGHGHAHSWWARLRHVFVPHSHHSSDSIDGEVEASRKGLRALWLSFAGLGLTAAIQGVLIAFTGSVALLSDTLHNIADALTAVPLAIAFLLGRRAVSKRFTYGLGRAEDLAGLAIVVVIAASAGLAIWQAVDRLLAPQAIDHLGWLAAAGVVGFVGNELVAQYRIRVGRQIGSAALVADGLHARTDGFTSLAVLLSAGGAALGWRWADPVVGLAIAAAILAVLWGASREVFGRLLDGVDPALVAAAEDALRDTPGVCGIEQLRLRWVGHSLHAEVDVSVDPEITVTEAHHIAHEAEHQLLHALPRLARATVHVNPHGPAAGDAHARLAHHAKD